MTPIGETGAGSAPFWLRPSCEKTIAGRTVKFHMMIGNIVVKLNQTNFMTKSAAFRNYLNFNDGTFFDEPAPIGG